MDRVDEIVLMCWFWFSFFVCFLFLFLSFCLSLSLFLSVSFSLCFFCSPSRSLSFVLFLFLSLSLPFSLSLFLPLLPSFPLSFLLSLSLFLFLSFALSSCFSLSSLSSSLSLSSPAFVSFSPCFSFSLCVPFPFFLCLPVCLFLSLSACLSVCLSLFRPFVWFRGNVVMPFNTCARFHFFWCVNGSTVTWVDANLASDSSTVRNQIREVQQVDRVNGIYGSSSWRCPETFYVRDFQRHVPDQDPQEWHHGIFRLVGFTLRQLFDTTTSEEKYMNQQGQHEGPRRRM